jgi:hypothetical protein
VDFKPESVDLLLVAEAPPSTLDRYFYVPDVREEDSLFRLSLGASNGGGGIRTHEAAHAA